MRVSASMFGKPGKCVSCRQKLRVPAPEEDVWEDGSLYLREHPEFLRGPLRADTAAAEAAPPAAPEAVVEAAPPQGAHLEGAELARIPRADKGEEHEPPSRPASETDDTVLPLEDFEPLQILCSYEQKIARRLRTLEQGGEVAGEKAALMSYRSLVRKLHARLDQGLREELRQIEHQAAAVEEELTRATLAARTGGMDFAAFRRLAAELRGRRDALQRRRQNLRGWLQAEDPELVGGYRDLPLEDVPCGDFVLESFEVQTPEKPLLYNAVEEMREALRGREHAERQAVEWKRMAGSGSIAAPALEHGPSAPQVLRRRNAAHVSFARARIEQILRDCESDVKSIKAQLRLARERLQAEQLSRPEYQNLEVELLSAQSDLTRAHDLARHALLANTTSDVPRPDGTFLQRMGHRARVDGIRWDAYFAWFAAALMLLAVFVPVLGDAPGRNMDNFPGLVMLLVAGAVLLGFGAALPWRLARGLLYTTVWLAATLGTALILHETWHSVSSMGALLRATHGWYLSPGVFVLVLSSVLLGAASFTAIFDRGVRSLIPLTAAGLLGLLLAVIFTDAGGWRQARPMLEPPTLGVEELPQGRVNAVVQVANEGRRPFWISDTPSGLPASARLLLERRTEDHAWQPVRLLRSMRVDGGSWQAPVSEESFPTIRLQPGDAAAFAYALPLGTYRLRMQPHFRDLPEQTVQFAVPEQLAVSARPARPDFEGVLEGAGARPPAPPSMAATFELGGIINAEGHMPRFYAYIRPPGSRETTRYLALGDQIHGQWRASEFNPVTKRLTLSDGTTVIVVQAGERVTLE